MLAISAPILWWKRRLNGSLKLPPQRQDMSRGKAATAVAVGLGIFYPLTGATVLLALIADRLLFGGARATAA
jgi:uncharacterized iron-regulated membrane protein